MAISGSAGDECRAFAVVPAPELLNVVLCDLPHIDNRAAPRLGGCPGRGAVRSTPLTGPTAPQRLPGRSGRKQPANESRAAGETGRRGAGRRLRGTTMGTTTEDEQVIRGVMDRWEAGEAGGARARAGRGRRLLHRGRDLPGDAALLGGTAGSDGVLRLPADGHAGRVQGPGAQATGRGGGARLPVGRLLLHRQG